MAKCIAQAILALLAIVVLFTIKSHWLTLEARAVSSAKILDQAPFHGSAPDRQGPPSQLPTIVLTRAALEPLFQGQLPERRAQEIAESLDGAQIDCDELASCGVGRGELVYRTTRIFFVRCQAEQFPPNNAAPVQLENSPAAIDQAPQRLFGIDPEAKSVAELCRWLDSHGERLAQLTVGECPSAAVPLTAWLGIYRMEESPKTLHCKASSPANGELTQIELMLEYLTLPVEFRYVRRSPGDTPIITAIERVDGLEWRQFVRDRLLNAPLAEVSEVAP
jgi:hypothetical protein